VEDEPPSPGAPSASAEAAAPAPAAAGTTTSAEADAAASTKPEPEAEAADDETALTARRSSRRHSGSRLRSRSAATPSCPHRREVSGHAGESGVDEAAASDGFGTQLAPSEAEAAAMTDDERANALSEGRDHHHHQPPGSTSSRSDSRPHRSAPGSRRHKRWEQKLSALRAQVGGLDRDIEQLEVREDSVWFVGAAFAASVAFGGGLRGWGARRSIAVVVVSLCLH
jgi:hypothetical protein